MKSKMEEAKERMREKMEDSTLDERGDKYEHKHDKTPAERAYDEKIQAKEADDATRHDDYRDRTEGRFYIGCVLFFFFFGKKMFWENQCLATFEGNAVEELDELDLFLLEFEQEMAKPAADPTRVVQINISQDLLHLVLAVSFAKDTNQILSSNVAGFIYIIDVDIQRRKITYLTPSAGELLSRMFIHGSWLAA
ncbi:hypothetical protein Drorol1_Dr00023851 [Drosera rotundifolia]